MADLQNQFQAFEATIRIDPKLEKAVLVEKRERILTRLSDGISAQRSAGGEEPHHVRTLA